MRILVCIFILIGLTTCKKKQLDLEVSFSVDNLTSADEFYKNAIEVTIELNQVADRDVYIKYSKNTAITTAAEGSDFALLPTDNYFVIPKGQRSKSFSFIILQDNDFQESDEKIQFNIIKTYSAEVKKGGDSYTFTIKSQPKVMGGSANLNMNGTYYSTISSNLYTQYINSVPNAYHYGLFVKFGSLPAFDQVSLQIRSKTILPVGTIIPITDLTNAPDTGAYVILGGSGSISDTLKVVDNDTINKTMVLYINANFTGNNYVIGTIEYSFYDFSH